MQKIVINGSKRLAGEIIVQGSKNAALPIIAASVLKKGCSYIYRCPMISDVKELLHFIKKLGCKVTIHIDDSIEIDATDAHNVHSLENDTGKTRAEILLLGAMLGRFGEAVVLQPGGCSIGKRPIDYHIDAIRKMNVVVDSSVIDNKIILECSTKGIHGNVIRLEFPSVGTTENIILTAVLAKGITHIENAAKEPEIRALCDFLRLSGAEITGDGTNDIYISGVSELHDCKYFLPEDRIVAGTYITAAAVAGGEIVLRKINPVNIKAVTDILMYSGCKINKYNDSLSIRRDEQPDAPGYISTGPYPDFPTDMQSQMMVFASVCNGESVIEENIFEDRFLIVPELEKMNADINIENNRAIVRGGAKLKGNNLTARELRGGAALVIAGISAEGRTVVDNAEYIYRGYEDICRDMKLIGADITLNYGG